jgi:DNA repair protein RecO
MAYTVYTTPALVCGSFDSNTADKTAMLFTRDAGMIYAAVKSAREERSKHRYALTEFSLLNVSLVQGKSGWRIVGTEPVANMYTKLETRMARAYVRNVVRFVKRMVRGEDANPHLFEHVASALRAATELSDHSRAEYETIYHICALLGYLPERNLTERSTQDIVRDIEKAIGASHL